VTNSSAQLVCRYEGAYPAAGGNPYARPPCCIFWRGKIVEQDITPELRYLFTGQELESEISSTSFWNFRARMFNSEIGLFYAPDPAHQSYSRYGYCLGNPINFVDPTGRETQSDDDIRSYFDQMRNYYEGWFRSSMIGLGRAMGTPQSAMRNQVEQLQGYYTQYTLRTTVGHTEGDVCSNTQGLIDPGTWVIDAIRTITWFEWSMVLANSQYYDLAEGAILYRMQNMEGFGNKGYEITGREGYGQGQRPRNWARWSFWRNDCSRRVGYALFKNYGLTSGNAGNYFGAPVEQDPTRLQVVVWPGEHIGLTKDNMVYDMTPKGYHHGRYTVERVSGWTEVGKPVFYDIR
jgi:RHS repeat-associated protein